MGLLIVITIILIVLKALEFIAIGWFWVFLPLILDVVIIVVLWLFAAFGIFKGFKFMNRSFNDKW